MLIIFQLRPTLEPSTLASSQREAAQSRGFSVEKLTERRSVAMPTMQQEVWSVIDQGCGQRVLHCDRKHAPPSGLPCLGRRAAKPGRHCVAAPNRQFANEAAAVVAPASPDLTCQDNQLASL